MAMHHISFNDIKMTIKTTIETVPSETGEIEKYVNWTASQDGKIFASGIDDIPVDIQAISEMAEQSLGEDKIC